jgi:uncharacterized membrane protein
MTEPLRPMSTGQLLDHTFALYRRNFLLFVGIAMVGPAANVIFQLLTLGANVGSPFSAGNRVAAAAAMARLGLGMLFGYVVMLAGMAISHAATVKAVAAVYLGQETSVIGAYRALRGRMWSLFGTFGLIFFWMALWMMLVVVVMMAVMVPIFMGLGAGRRRAAPGAATAMIGAVLVFAIFALAVVGFIAIYVRYALAIQACVVENLGPRASLKRSISLSKGSRWRVVVIYLIFVLLAMILGFGLGAIAGGAGTLLHNRIAAAVLIYLAGFVAGSITGPLATIGLSLLYYDERVRKEAFDLQLMLSSLTDPGAPSAPSAQTTPAQTQI